MRVQYCTTIHSHRQKINSLTQRHQGCFTALLGTVLKQNFTKTHVLVYFLFLSQMSQNIKNTTDVRFPEEGNYSINSPQLTQAVIG